MTDPTIIDVRPLLAAGQDPLLTVVERAGGVDTLTVDAPFNPLPLRRVLAQSGFSSTAEKLGEGHWRVRLIRDGRGDVAGPPTAEDCQGLPDPGAPVRRDGDRVHLDLRGLTPPLPLLAILRLCAAVGPDDAIEAVLDRDPLYLYPELAAIGWNAETIPAEAGEVRLRLTRESR